MIKFFFAFFLLLTSSVMAQETTVSAEEDATVSAPAIITPEQRWLKEKDWRKNVNYAAENYRPERIREMARAAEALKKRRATTDAGVGKTKGIKYHRDAIDVNNPESIKKFMNNKFKKDMDDAISNNEIINGGREQINAY